MGVNPFGVQVLRPTAQPPPASTPPIAGPGPAAPRPAPGSRARPLAEQLAELGRLRDAGALTEAEFMAAKRRVLET